MNSQISLIGHSQVARRGPQQAVGSLEFAQGPIASPAVTVDLDREHLDASGVVAFDATDPRTKPFDALRRRVLQVMAERGWNAIGILPVTVGCGATLTAVNLGFSMARDFGREVLLVDGDPETPRVGRSLGVARSTELESMKPVQCNVGPVRSLAVLQLREASADTPWAALDGMTNDLARVKAHFRPSTIVVDLPPLLDSDAALPLLAELDGAVLIARAGVTTADDVEQCLGMVPANRIAEIVLNRTGER